MKRCDRCQERQATVHMTDISDMEIQDETHLCSECAESEGLQYNVELDLSDLIPDELNIDEIDEIQNREEEIADLKCPECGMTFEEFQETRRLGCPDDYEIFSPGLDPLLEQIHDRLEHTGKVPSGVNDIVEVEHKIQKAEHELQTAVNEEKFERAAELRDRIDELRNKISSLADKNSEEQSTDSEAAEQNTSTDTQRDQT